MEGILLGLFGEGQCKWFIFRVHIIVYIILLLSLDTNGNLSFKTQHIFFAFFSTFYYDYISQIQIDRLIVHRTWVEVKMRGDVNVGVSVFSDFLHISSHDSYCE